MFFSEFKENNIDSSMNIILRITQYISPNYIGLLFERCSFDQVSFVVCLNG